MSLRLPATQTIWVSVVSALLAVFVGLLAGLDPPLAIAAALGLAFTLICLADLTIGLTLFTFLGFIVVVPNFAGETLSILKVAALPLLVSWVAMITRAEGRRRNLLYAHPGYCLALLVFLAWVTVGMLWAFEPSLVPTSAFRYALAAILVFVVYAGVRTERDVKLIAAAMVAGAVCAAAYGFLHPAPEEFGQLSRLGGTLGNPNELATVLVLGIGLCIGLATASKDVIVKSLCFAAGAICLAAILETGSRAGLIALFAMMIAAIVVATGRRIRLVTLTMVILLVGIGWFLVSAPPQSRERILHPGSGSGRTDIWTVGTREIAAHPLTGVGGGNFAPASITYLLRPGSLAESQYIVSTPKVAENTYLEVFAELGLPGFLLFLGLVGFTLGCGLRALHLLRARGQPGLQAMATAFVVSTFGLLVADFFGSKEYARELWLLMGMGIALLGIARRLPPAVGTDR
jgi:O-antigen ligase